MKPSNSSIRMANGQPHQARKRFGQNFLHDQGVIQRIIDAIDPQAGDHLVEIGPGQGALTNPLAQFDAKLDCIELDRDLAAHLQQHYQNNETVQVYQHDMLKFDLEDLLGDNQGAGQLRIIGNLPYNISTPVIFHLLKKHHLIKDMIFMLQLEVVQRLAAKVGEKNYGLLGLMTQYFCDIQHLFNVPSAAYTPTQSQFSDCKAGAT